MILDPRLESFADTERQKLFLHTVNEAGGYRPAGKKLGVHHERIRAAIKSLINRAALQGFSPQHSMTKSVPDIYTIKRRSQNFVKGDLAQEWVISSPDLELKKRMIEAGFDAAAQELPRYPEVNLNTPTDNNLCNFYPMTDCHLGMLVNTELGGQEWNLEVAEEMLYRCFEQMIIRSPNASVGILGQMGDFIHSDGLKALTPRSGHLLDTACVYEDMARAAVRVLRRIVSLMLEKHDSVHLIMAEGNHDESGSIWLRVIFAALFENNNRVTVEGSSVPYYAYEFGENMICVHHGHLKRKEALPGLFANRFHQMWGRTTKRVVHVGHQHHEHTQEIDGMLVAQHPTLAPNDPHSTRHGYMSLHQATSITYHRKFGKVFTTTVCPEMLLAA